MNNFAAGGTAFLLEDPDATDFSDANAIMESPSYRNSKAQWIIFEFGGHFYCDHVPTVVSRLTTRSPVSTKGQPSQLKGALHW